MAFKDRINNWLGTNKAPEKFVEKKEVTLPISGGRQSAPDTTTLLNLLVDEFSEIAPETTFEFIPIIRKLAIYYYDLSNAVENITLLGTSGYTLKVTGASDLDIDKMSAEVKNAAKDWYKGGINNIIADSLAQIAIAGCLSFESVPKNDLTGILRAIPVDPYTIRFKYNAKDVNYVPFQNTSVSSGTAGVNLIELNETTYTYIPFKRFSEKPYGIPPFIAALDSIAIESDMVCGLRSIIKKLGVFGFLSVLVSPPAKIAGEAPATYTARVANYLRDTIEPEVQKGFSKGYVIGYKDKHEFDLQSTVQDMGEVEAMYNLITSNKHSGLKQDSMMLGRGQNNTTETLGRVLLAKMTQQIKSYQGIVQQYLSNLFALHLRLAGFTFDTLEVVLDAPLTTDAVKDQELVTAKLTNGITMYNQGLISQEQLANMVDLGKPYQKEPRAIVAPPTTNKEDDPTDAKSTDVNSMFRFLGGHYTQFDYGDHTECNCGGSFGSSPLENFILEYFGAIGNEYSKAVKKVSKKIADELLLLSATADEQTVIDLILFNLYTEWNNTFRTQIKPIISKFVTKFYRSFRKDISVFGKGVDIPDATFTQFDIRTLTYYKKSDELYLGKFITDQDSRKKLTAYIKEAYLNKGLPIGNNTSAIQGFRNEFQTTMNLSDWKIRRIIDTTVNRMKNTAAISYMKEAEVERYSILGITDERQCGYCRNLNGKKFNVVSAYESYENINSSEPQYVGFVHPFTTASIKDFKDIKTMTESELVSAGAHLPGFHPHCRCVVIAEI